MNRLLASRSITRITSVVIASFVVWACDGPAAPDGGGGPMDGGGEGGTTFTCSRDSDCGDRSLFCADWRCRPGEPGTDARGCIDLGPPCDGGACDEEADRCGVPSWCTEGRDGCLAPGDCDGDGEPATECGGHDCDDSDGNRYPGNPEVCDAEHRDEDCDPTTLGDTDADGDTFISSACCNSQPDGSLRCGDDCADDDVNRNPSAAESCNGLDDDCDGVLDDGGGLCPGGSCVGGVCDFDAWDRTFGAGSTDSARDVAIDSSGAVYIAGEIHGSADFGAGPRTVTGATTNPRGLFVVSYTADGTHRWDYVSPAASALESVRLAVSPDGARVYAVGYASGADFGSGATEGAFVLVLDGTSGAYLIDRRYGNVGEELRDVVADAAGVTAVGRFDSTTSWGGPSRDRAGSVSGVVLRLDREGAYEWDRVIHATGTSSSRRVEVNAVDRLPTGEIVIGGRYGGGGGLELGDTLPVPSTSGGGSFVARLSADAEPMWARALQATLGFVTVESVAVGLEDRVFVVGRYMRSLVPGTGDSFTT
ncbi:MAG TPA: putative metal-binding motif-containing protein, partial [Sandaracinaceae bacterium]